MPEVNFNLLNPSAELYSGPQVQMDPVAAYEKAKATRQSNMLAQLYAKHYDPQTGGVNYNALIPEAAQSGLDVSQLMPGLREQQESMASIAQKRALQQQEEATAAAKQQEMFDTGVKSAMTYSRSELDNIETPEQYLKWHEATHADPYLSKYFAAHGINKDDRLGEISSTLAQEGGLQKLIDKSKKGLDSILGVKPKEYTPTELEKLISLRNVYKVGTPERTDLENKIKLETTRAPAASTTVNLPPQELAESKAFGEQLVKDYSENIKPAADQARKSLNTVDVLQNLLDKGLQTGWGTELEGQARSALARMGVEGAKDLAGDIQTFKAFVRQNVLNEQMKQKGVQTEGDAQRIEETFARLGNTTESNRFLLDVRRAQLNRDIAQQKFWTDWKSKHGTFDGAENAWLEGEGSKSLFDAPTLKKYKPAAAPAGAKAMPTGVKLKTYADQHFNGDQVKAKAYLTSQGYK